MRVLTPMWPTSAPGLAQVCSYSASLIDLMGPTAPPPSVAPQVQLGAIGAAASAVLSSDEAKAELQRVRQQVGELEGSLQVRRAIGLHNTISNVGTVTCTHVRARLHALTHARTHASMRACERACTRMHSRMLQCVHANAHAHACTHACFNACMRTRMHAHARIEACAHTLLAHARC